MKIVYKNRFSGKTYFIQFVPVSILEAEADVVEHGELLVVAEIEAGDHAVVRDGEKGEILARVHLDS